MMLNVLLTNKLIMKNFIALLGELNDNLKTSVGELQQARENLHKEIFIFPLQSDNDVRSQVDAFIEQEGDHEHKANTESVREMIVDDANWDWELSERERDVALEYLASKTICV